MSVDWTKPLETNAGYATRSIEELAKRPHIEKAARALAENDRGCDDDYWLYDDEVAIALRESGALTLIAALIPWAMAGGMPAAELKAAEVFVGETGK